MPAWPANLPRPNLAGYKVKRRNALRRTEMSAGLARQRRISLAKVYDVSVVWRFTQSQKAVFNAFFENELYAGAAWFTLQLTIDGTFTTFNARFIPDSIDESALPSVNWEVAASLELQPI
jgi:hypothetical protein